MHTGKRVLVTGATGLLGRVFCMQLVQHGYQVTGIFRSEAKVQEVREELKYYTDNAERIFNQINWIPLDFEDEESIETVLREHDVVIHCAALVSFNPSDRKALYKTNVEYTVKLLQASQDAGIQHFIHISSIASFDEKHDAEVITEESSFNPKVSHSFYALSKHLAEMEVWRAEAEGLKVSVLNPGVIIGSGNWEQSSGVFFKTLLQNPFTFSGRTGYVDVRNVAEAGLFCLINQTAKANQYILVSENISYADMAKKIRLKVGKSVPKTLSPSTLKILWGITRIPALFSKKLRIISLSGIDALTSSSTYSSEKYELESGKNLTPINDSIEFHFKNYLQYIQHGKGSNSQ